MSFGNERDFIDYQQAKEKDNRLAPTVLKIRCMYCRTEMGEKDGKGIDGETGSICRKCWAERFPGVPYPEEDSQNEERRAS